MDRRTFIAAAGAAAAQSVAGNGLAAAASADSIPIIDTHIHLFDPTRPLGVPVEFPGPTGKTGSFPDAFEKLATPFGVVGALHVEASNWVEDNLWALERCAANDFMLGVVGNLNPEVPEFATYLERYQRHPLFLGIRYGNIWGYDLAAHSRDRAVLDRLKLVAQADLVMDSATPTMDILQALVRVNDAIPDLRLVINHLPSLTPAAGAEAAYEKLLRELQGRPNVFVKLSQIIHPVGGKVSTRLDDHRAGLEQLVAVFGEDRIMFGSDYPTSDMWTSVDNVFAIAKEYFAGKPRPVAEKYFWKNSLRVYKWSRRRAQQPAAT